jgi:hypothetical protein
MMRERFVKDFHIYIYIYSREIVVNVVIDSHTIRISEK